MINIDYIIFTVSIICITFLIERKRKALFSDLYVKKGLENTQKLIMVFIFLLVSGGWLFVRLEEKFEMNEIYKSLAGIAPTMAIELEKMNHEKINLNTAPDDAVYLGMIRNMVDWMKINPQIDSIYTLRKLPNGTNVFILGPETDYDRNGKIEGELESRIPIGVKYDEPIVELEQAFKGKYTFQDKANEDKWGAFVTAYGPIYNKLGKVDAVLGIDLNEKSWIHQIRLARLKTIGLLFILYMLIISTYWVNSQFRSAIRKLERKEKEVLNSEAKYQNLVGLSPDAIMVLQGSRIVYINKVGLQLLKVKHEQDIIGKSISMFFHENDHEFIGKIVNQMQLGEKIENIEKEICSRDDQEKIHIEISGAPIHFGDLPSYQLVVRNITKRKQQEEKIFYQAYFDSLTDLPNRHFVYEKMERAFEKSLAPITVMMIDLDRFKWINETFGQRIGDQILQETAQRLKIVVRGENIVSRYNADEFIVVFPYLPRKTAVKVVNRILNHFREPFHINSQDIFLTVSVGVSIFPEDGQTAATVLKNAEQALNHAKSKGSQSFEFYVHEMHELISRKVEIENGLRRAIEKNELVLFYQPQINLTTGEFVGVEALVRWNHTEAGMISPSEFIPIAEETGMIIPIGEWILHKACQQLKYWLEQGYPQIRMAVNLSSVQFMDVNIVKTISNVIQQEGIPPELLEVEITESLAMNVDQMLDNLIQIKQLGVIISIDDFGTGYSSLSYLKKFPVDKLKIDQSFVKNIPHDEEDNSIVSTIVSMAHHLGLTVIAEGTETEEQVQYLVQQGCEEAQGYLFGKPVPSHEIEILLKQGERQGDRPHVPSF